MLPGFLLAGDRLAASTPLLKPRWGWWGQPGKFGWVQGKGVHSDPWGWLFPLPFGEGAPVAKLKLGWGRGSSEGQGCHLLGYVLNQGGTNSSLWLSWRLFVFF